MLQMWQARSTLHGMPHVNNEKRPKNMKLKLSKMTERDRVSRTESGDLCQGRRTGIGGGGVVNESKEKKKDKKSYHDPICR